MKMEEEASIKTQKSKGNLSYLATLSLISSYFGGILFIILSSLSQIAANGISPIIDSLVEDQIRACL